MSEYILIVLWLGLAAIISTSARLQRKETVLGATEYRYKPLWAFLIFLPVIIWVGLRPPHFIDTGSYINSFIAAPTTISDLIPLLKTITKDAGFTVFIFIIKSIIGNHVTFYLLIVSALQSFCLIKVYRKFSSSYILSIFLFIISTDYIAWMFNGMRQFIAVTIMFACIALIVNKKFVPVIIIILLVSTIHGSALLMIPMIFVAQGKAFNKLTVLFLLGVMSVILFLGQFTSILADLLQNTQYNDILTNEIWVSDNGTNILRVLVYTVPAAIALWKLRVIHEKNDKIINLCVNMSIISSGLYLVSVFTSGIYVGRLPIYFSLYNYILLPWEIKNLFEGNSRKIVLITMISMYLLFYYYQMHGIWALF